MKFPVLTVHGILSTIALTASIASYLRQSLESSEPWLFWLSSRSLPTPKTRARPRPSLVRAVPTRSGGPPWDRNCEVTKLPAPVGAAGLIGSGTTLGVTPGSQFGAGPPVEAQKADRSPKSSRACRRGRQRKVHRGGNGGWTVERQRRHFDLQKAPDFRVRTRQERAPLSGRQALSWQGAVG